MKRTKLLSGVLALMLTATMISGCGGEKKTAENPASSGESVEFNGFPSKLKAEKVGTIKISDEKSMSVTDGGIYYETKDGKYGVASLDGKQDTGAVYAYCMPVGNYFAVVKEIPEGQESKDINCFSIIDATGKEIIPDKYATANMINDRYIQVCEATEPTDSKDDALIFASNSIFALYPDGDDKLFKGTWYVYDVQTGKKIEGVTGTQGYPVTARGEIITYTTDDKETKYVDNKGVALPEEANVFPDGSYALEKDKDGTVYSDKGEELFAYNTEEFSPSGADEAIDIFKASKYVDGATIYALMDKTGKVISAEFEKNPTVYKDFILVENKVYDYEGKELTDASIKNVYTDTLTKMAYILKTDDDKAIIIDNTGKTLYETETTGDYSLDSTYFLACKKADGKTKYYSLKDKDFTIEGVVIAPWLVKGASDGDTAPLIDAISGETLLKDYKTYSYTDADNKACYIFAKKDAGEYDIYVIK